MAVSDERSLTVASAAIDRAALATERPSRDAESVNSAYFMAVREIVNSEDPIRLLTMGAPLDEYEPEVTDLVEEKSLMAAQRVHEVFQKSFGEANNLNAEAARRVASGISGARSEDRTG